MAWEVITYSCLVALLITSVFVGASVFGWASVWKLFAYTAALVIVSRVWDYMRSRWKRY